LPTAQPTASPTQPLPTATAEPTSLPALAPSPTPLPAVVSDPEVDQAIAGLSGLEIEAFFEQSFAALLRRDPEWIIELGLEDQYELGESCLTNLSAGAMQETQRLEAAILEMLNAYDWSSLSEQQKLTAEVYAWYLQDRVRLQPYMDYDYPINPFITGVQIDTQFLFTDILSVSDGQDAQRYLDCLPQVADKFTQLIDGLERRKQAGNIAPRPALQAALGSIQAIAETLPRDTPYYTALEQKLAPLSSITPNDQRVLLAEAETRIQQSVIPAYRALDVKVKELIVEASNEVGLDELPGGDQAYAAWLRHYTSTEMSADEIHQLGLAEVERLQAETRQAASDLGFEVVGELRTIFNQAAADGGGLSGPAIVAEYERLIRQAEQDLLAAFDLLPQQQVIVIGGPTGGYYVGPSLDGARPGAFYAANTGTVMKYSMPSLAYHEAVPGHHFQIALAQELDQPLLRKALLFEAFAEGWALYAERLAYELGFYQDNPLGNLGRLQLELMRAVRLVVDTGLHAKDWSYEQAVDYMAENTGLPEGYVRSEVMRYVIWPGQATSYKIGMQKIFELRQQAMDTLGEDFDLKAFHRLVLGNGSMPLEILEEQVEEYIKQ
jgi:uncharacterized protein (DUF885 family)